MGNLTKISTKNDTCLRWTNSLRDDVSDLWSYYRLKEKIFILCYRYIVLGVINLILGKVWVAIVTSKQLPDLDQVGTMQEAIASWPKSVATQLYRTSITV